MVCAAKNATQKKYAMRKIAIARHIAKEVDECTATDVLAILRALLGLAQDRLRNGQTFEFPTIFRMTAFNHIYI